jgi:hypothetical protein
MYPISVEIAKCCDGILTSNLRDIKDRFIELVEKRNQEYNWAF